MSKRDDGGRRITKAEARLVEAATTWVGSSKGVPGCKCPGCRLVAAVRAVVRERGKKR